MIRIVEIFGAGVLAAYVMFLTNWLAFRSGWVRVSVVEVFNEFLSHLHPQNVHMPFQIPRAVTRLFIGGCFALIYAAFVATLPTHTMWTVVTMCTVLGFVHGFGVGTADAVLVAEGHPVSVYREFGHHVIATHLTSHLVYGVTLGLLFTLFS